MLPSRNDASSDQSSRYRTLREIGRGGMGVVYLVEDLVLQRNVALKVLYPALSSDEEFVERFRQEARLVSGVHDPRVVHINNLAVVEHRLAIDMEFVDGSPLHQFLAREFVTPSVALRIAHDMLAGLSACHDHGLVHCDIKPSNVLLSERGSVKLADFGLARAYSSCLDTPMRDKSTTGLLFGTPVYSPPEMWDGARPTPASDLYSVGVVLYEMLSGQVPYSGPTPLAVIKSMLTAPLPPLAERAPGLSPELCGLVHRLLQADPGSRPSSADEALVDLKKLPEYRSEDGDSPTISIPRRLHRTPPDTKRRRKRVAGGLVAAIVVIGMGLAVHLYHRSPKEINGSEHVSSPVAGISDGDMDNTGAKPALQATLNRERLSSTDELLAAWKSADPSTCGVFDVSSLDDRYPGFDRWLVKSTDAVGVNEIIGCSDAGLLTLRRTSAADAPIELSGSWAYYRNRAGSGIREGVVSARGNWSPGKTGLTFLLDFIDTTDNSTWQSTVTVSPSSHLGTDTQFFYDLQSRDAVLPLLYHELLSRDQAWAIDLEPNVTCLLGANVHVPLLPDEPAIVADGQLDESVWRTKYLDSRGSRMGLIGAHPLDKGAEMIIRASAATVYIGVRTPAVAAPSLRLAVLPRIGIPAPQSDTYILEIDARGAMVESRLAYGSAEKSWTPAVDIGASMNGNTWSVEIAIPASNLNAALAQNTLWRLNCEVVSQDASQRHPLYQWGFPDTEDALHGMLAEFQTPREIEPAR